MVVPLCSEGRALLLRIARMYPERAVASVSLAKISTRAPLSMPVPPGVAPESAIHAGEVYWLGRPKSLLLSSSSVTVVIPAPLHLQDAYDKAATSRSFARNYAGAQHPGVPCTASR